MHAMKRLIALLLASALGFAPAAWGEGVLDPHGPIAAAETQLLYEALGTMLLVVVPVVALTLVFAWWYRASNTRARHAPDWSYSGRIEFSIWIIPLLVVLFLAALCWVGSHELDPYKPIEAQRKPLMVQVVSLDWKWLFVYPELGIASVNEMAVPIGTPVHLVLTSATVMNSFFAPGIAGQIYTMAGMTTQLSFVAADAGLYPGQSAQFSGDGFSDMRFKVVANQPADFEHWVAAVRSSADRLDTGSYERLATLHATARVQYFGAVDGDIFGHALHHRSAPVLSLIGLDTERGGEKVE
jgi:cytochrome o ubiquinol oxidase subunit II